MMSKEITIGVFFFERVLGNTTLQVWYYIVKPHLRRVDTRILFPPAHPVFIKPTMTEWKYSSWNSFGSQRLHIVITFSDHYVKGKVVLLQSEEQHGAELLHLFSGVLSLSNIQINMISYLNSPRVYIQYGAQADPWTIVYLPFSTLHGSITVPLCACVPEQSSKVHISCVG